MLAIDLNADLGEGFGCWKVGDDRALLQIVTSANVACGGHAGDPETMFETASMASQYNVTIGAHPGFADKEGFGRRRLPLSAKEIERLVVTQVGALIGAVALAGAIVAYVKPHGALANWAAESPEIAVAIVNAVKVLHPSLAILAISGTHLDRAARNQGLPTYSEIYADRAYDRNGLLVSRHLPGAVLHDEAEILKRLRSFIESGRMETLDGHRIDLQAQSICIHGDTSGAVEISRSVRALLQDAGWAVRAFAPWAQTTPLWKSSVANDQRQTQYAENN
jgi:5-oxoprolinase (ATP-hydrolysing) subunit A